MRIELEVDETRELLISLINSIAHDSGLNAPDLTAIRKWRATLKPGSEAMREFTAKVNADLARVLEGQKRSAIMKPDWQ
jgi:hypothetical protein